jgi:hypothetical protein
MLEHSERVRQAAKSANLVPLRNGEMKFFDGDDPAWSLAVYRENQDN